ncbi:MAG: hypothetical protein RLZZ09_2416 [Pseudomonadota bacterium]|jgi:hypothetical protein
MQKPHFEPVIDPEVFRHAFEMLAIGNVAAHRAQARNRALNIPNYYSIAGRIVSDQSRDDERNAADAPSTDAFADPT